MKRQPIDWKIILANHTCDKELNTNYLTKKKEKISYNTIAESKQPDFKIAESLTFFQASRNSLGVPSYSAYSGLMPVTG